MLVCKIRGESGEEWYKKVPCPVCEKIGSICYSKRCNASFICLACGQRRDWNEIAKFK